MNRDQFIAALQSTFNPQVFDDVFSSFEAIFTNNQTKMYSLLTDYLRAQGRIAYYLSLWDAAPDQPSKDAVAGSVTSDLGNATVDPSTALSWPGNGGIFGNVKGPASSVDQTHAIFDGTTGQLIKQANGSSLQAFSALVDGKTVGNTLLVTVPAGKTFIPIKATYTLINVTGLSLVSTVSIGSNSPNYNDISGATLLTGLSVQGKVLSLDLSSPTSAAASSNVYARVSIASTATTYNLMASVIGFFI